MSTKIVVPKKIAAQLLPILMAVLASAKGNSKAAKRIRRSVHILLNQLGFKGKDKLKSKGKAKKPRKSKARKPKKGKKSKKARKGGKTKRVWFPSSKKWVTFHTK